MVGKNMVFSNAFPIVAGFMVSAFFNFSGIYWIGFYCGEIYRNNIKAICS